VNVADAPRAIDRDVDVAIMQRSPRLVRSSGGSATPCASAGRSLVPRARARAPHRLRERRGLGEVVDRRHACARSPRTPSVVVQKMSA
jgi:hypothetical protein